MRQQKVAPPSVLVEGGLRRKREVRTPPMAHMAALAAGGRRQQNREPLQGSASPSTAAFASGGRGDKMKHEAPFYGSPVPPTACAAAFAGSSRRQSRSLPPSSSTSHNSGWLGLPAPFTPQGARCIWGGRKANFPAIMAALPRRGSLVLVSTGVGWGHGGVMGQQDFGMGYRGQRLKGQRAWGIGVEGSKGVRHWGARDWIGAMQTDNILFAY